MLGQHFTPNKVAHQHRNQRHSKERTGRHGVGFGERQWRKHSPFLRLKRKHRHETDGNDQQREKQRGADFRGRPGDNLPSVLGCEWRSLHMLVHVLYHNDGPIDHSADSNGDSAERHNVGVDALPVHDGKRHQNAHRQADNRHQRRADVKQKDNAHQADDQKFFQQLKKEVVDGALNQARTVVNRDHFNAIGQARLQLGQLGLNAIDGFLGIFTETHHHDATNGLPFPVKLGNTAPHLWPHFDTGHILEQNRCAVYI